MWLLSPVLPSQLFRPVMFNDWFGCVPVPQAQYLFLQQCYPLL